jgi:hypothetical protein
MTEPYRHCISTFEEIWVRACNEFFEKNGRWDWYIVPKETAFRQIMTFTRGQGNPDLIKQKVEQLYKDAGVVEI